MIDPNVIDALNFSRSADLSSFHNLSNYLNEHLVDASAASITGDHANLSGYVAERVAAADLVAQGHVVTFPDTSNNPGWDLMVDGHPVQIKNTLDAGIIKEHFLKYPDIPVITNTEMSQYFSHDPNVMIDPSLSHAAIAAKIDTTVHGVNALESGSFHIPLITLALSCAREGKLLFNNKTDFTSAGKHIALDTASVGGGGFIGGKTGAMVGGLVGGPVGVALGAILGAIWGAISGRILKAGFIRRPVSGRLLTTYYM